MKKRLIAVLSILFLSLSQSLVSANAAVKPGGSCNTVGKTLVESGKTFTCIQSGGKLIWNKGRSIQKTNSTINNVYFSPSQPTDNIETCKINEVNLNGPRNGHAGPGGASIPLPSGFPRVSTKTQSFGTVKWALIPIDFPDLKGESNFRVRVDSQMKLLSDWFNTVSEGKFKVEWVVSNKWVTLSGKTSEYAIKKSVNSLDSSVGQNLFKDAMKSADSDFDFRGVQTVNFILPKGQKFITESSQGFPWDKVVLDTVTNEGSISSYTIPGVFFDEVGREYWSYWAHEFGHAISIPHVGRSRGSLPPYSPFDIMGSQDGSTRELSGWLRYLAGWLPDEKVYCKELKNLGSVDLSLVPISSPENGYKMAVIPMSESNAILIEARRFTKFSCGIPTKNGVLVYEYDANLSHGEDFLKPVNLTGRKKENHFTNSKPCNLEPFSDPLLYQGDKVIVDGITIENLSQGSFNKIRISKKS
jgi:M6 family metalloprotease-like protein